MIRTRALRFVGVTVVTALLGQFLIFTFFVGLRWPALVSNAVAVAVVAAVGFVLSIRFVWTEADEQARTGQAAAFMASSFLGLLISSICVAVVTTATPHPLGANLGSFVGYGIAWGIRFLLLDRVVFRSAT